LILPSLMERHNRPATLCAICERYMRTTVYSRKARKVRKESQRKSSFVILAACPRATCRFVRASKTRVINVFIVRVYEKEFHSFTVALRHVGRYRECTKSHADAPARR